MDCHEFLKVCYRQVFLVVNVIQQKIINKNIIFAVEHIEEAKAHAKIFVPTISFWSSCVFRNGLSAMRSDQEKDDLVEQLFKRYEDVVASSPENHGMDMVHAHLHIAKVRDGPSHQ